MQYGFSSHEDAGLARKIRRLRIACLGFGILSTSAILLLCLRGELVGRGSSYGGRLVSDGELVTLYWADSPGLYLLTASFYLLTTVFVVFCLYAVLARTVEKAHVRERARRWPLR